MKSFGFSVQSFKGTISTMENPVRDLVGLCTLPYLVYKFNFFFLASSDRMSSKFKKTNLFPELRATSCISDFYVQLWTIVQVNTQQVLGTSPQNMDSPLSNPANPHHLGSQYCTLSSDRSRTTKFTYLFPVPLSLSRPPHDMQVYEQKSGKCKSCPS